MAGHALTMGRFFEAHGRIRWLLRMAVYAGAFFAFFIHGLFVDLVVHMVTGLAGLIQGIGVPLVKGFVKSGGSRDGFVGGLFAMTLTAYHRTGGLIVFDQAGMATDTPFMVTVHDFLLVRHIGRKKIKGDDAFVHTVTGNTFGSFCRKGIDMEVMGKINGRAFTFSGYGSSIDSDHIESGFPVLPGHIGTEDNRRVNCKNQGAKKQSRPAGHEHLLKITKPMS
jgi:hypothetical protein